MKLVNEMGKFITIGILAAIALLGVFIITIQMFFINLILGLFVVAAEIGAVAEFIVWGDYELNKRR